MRVLLATGGHPFERELFLEVFDALAATWDAASGDEVVVELVVEHVEQPGVLDRVGPGVVVHGEPADVVVFYDMPGLRFVRGADDSDLPVEFLDPPVGYVAGLRELLRSGVGLVFLHHAIASWPTSPEFADLVGGRFHYQPGELRGVSYPDSGYAFDVTHTVEVLEPTHPICAGLPPTFALTDELYLFPVFADDVVPLLRTTHAMTDPETGGFFSADLAIRGTRNSRDGWTHPPGSDLVAWVRDPVDVEGGRLAYLQFGDGPVTYADPIFRQILANAISWAGSRAA